MGRKLRRLKNCWQIQTKIVARPEVSSCKSWKEWAVNFCDMTLGRGIASAHPGFEILKLRNLSKAQPERLKLPWFRLLHAPCWSYWHHLRHHQSRELCTCFFSSAIPYLAFVWVLLGSRWSLCTKRPVTAVSVRSFRPVNHCQLRPDSIHDFMGTTFAVLKYNRQIAAIEWQPCLLQSGHKIFQCLLQFISCPQSASRLWFQLFSTWL